MTRSASPQKDQRTGTWWFVVDLGPGPDGKRRQARRRGFTTKKAAQKELDRLRVRVHEGTFVKPERVTVAEYLDRWLDSLATSGIRPSTIASYRRNLRLHVLPHLGAVVLQRLGPLELDHLYARLVRDGNRMVPGPLSNRTVLYVHTILRKALADAMRKGLVVRNVADAASPPSAKSARAPEMAWWQPDELARFLAFVADDELYPLFRLAAMTGMRRGEVCAVRWSDLDLDAGRATVRQQLVVVDHVPMFSERTKTDHGRRSLDLDAKTVSVLRAHRARQAANRLAIGGGYRDDLVFAQVDGSPLHPESVAKVFDRRVTRSGLTRIRFHDLRHSHCAALIAAGQDAKVISRRLGHASVSFTYDRYGHLMPEADSAAATAVALLVDAAEPVVTNS